MAFMALKCRSNKYFYHYWEYLFFSYKFNSEQVLDDFKINEY